MTTAMSSRWCASVVLSMRTRTDGRASAAWHKERGKVGSDGLFYMFQYLFIYSFIYSIR